MPHALAYDARIDSSQMSRTPIPPSSREHHRSGRSHNPISKNTWITNRKLGIDGLLGLDGEGTLWLLVRLTAMTDGRPDEWRLDSGSQVAAVDDQPGDGHRGVNAAQQ